MEPILPFLAKSLKVLVFLSFSLDSSCQAVDVSHVGNVVLLLNSPEYRNSCGERLCANRGVGGGVGANRDTFSMGTRLSDSLENSGFSKIRREQWLQERQQGEPYRNSNNYGHYVRANVKENFQNHQNYDDYETSRYRKYQDSLKYSGFLDNSKNTGSYDVLTENDGTASVGAGISGHVGISGILGSLGIGVSLNPSLSLGYKSSRNSLFQRSSGIPLNSGIPTNSGLPTNSGI